MKRKILSVFAFCTMVLAAQEANAQWSTTGNAGTTPPTNFVGTTDNQALVFKTNNTEKVRIGTNGTLAIGTTLTGGVSSPKILCVGGGTIFSASSSPILDFTYAGYNSFQFNGGRTFIYGVHNGTSAMSQTNILQVASGRTGGMNHMLAVSHKLYQGSTTDEYASLDAYNYSTAMVAPSTAKHLMLQSYVAYDGTIGSVGIGSFTAAPTSRLHLNGGNFQITGTNAPNNTKLGLTLGENTGYTWLQSTSAKPFAINPQGTDYVAIGFAPGAYTVPAGYQLAVKGNIICEGMLVKLAGNWPDYVFSKDYSLMPLNELESYINTNQHLPSIPSAAEMEKTGINSAEMDRMLLEKIEELTLYTIELQKELNSLKKQMAEKENSVQE